MDLLRRCRGGTKSCTAKPAEPIPLPHAEWIEVWSSNPSSASEWRIGGLVVQPRKQLCIIRNHVALSYIIRLAKMIEGVNAMSNKREAKSQQAENSTQSNTVDRRTFLAGAAAGAATLALPRWARAESGFFSAFDDDLSAIRAEVSKRHDETVKRMQTWIRQPSIAAENRGMNECCELTMQMLREAGFHQVSKIPTDGQPGIFVTLDAGAPKTLGLYFMYDVKQVDPSEWSSPPWDAALVDKPGFGKVIVGRGAVNQKGPKSAFIAALHAIRGAGRKLPVNFVFVAEG